MKKYSKDKIRNLVLLGHGGSGKTTLTEAILYNKEVVKRMGKVEDGNTVSDFDKEEKERQFSIGSSVIPVEFEETKLNFIDTPGYFDFIGEVFASMSVSSGAVIVVDASSGVEVGTEKARRFAEQRNVPRVIFLNKMDKENVKFNQVLEDLRSTLGNKVVPFAVPIGEEKDFRGFVDIVSKKGYVFDGKKCVEGEATPEALEQAEELRETLMEAVAETNEEMLEKYFAGESFTDEEIREGLKAAVNAGELVPVVVGSAVKTIGVRELMHVAEEYLPTALDKGAVEGEKDGEPAEIPIDEDGPLAAFVFKTVIDPYVGKISIFKVVSGCIKKDMNIYIPNSDKKERMGSVFNIRGKEQIEADEICAGDIGATAKLEYANTGDTICEEDTVIKLPEIEYPKPCLFRSVVPKSKEDEEKIGTALHKLADEDPTFIYTRNKETKQLLIGGQGTMQLTVVTNKMKRSFNVEVDLYDPKVAFRETIKGKSDVQGKHKKQSGGAGQYGDVYIKFEPCDEDFIFEEEIFGGSVPKQYIPAVEKGIRESLNKGPLAGYPVVNIKATLYDGSYHSVDSSEMAFKVAASLAFRKGIKEADPILLEPINRVTIVVPEENLGDIMGDMNKRRGRILGMEPRPDGTQKIKAEAPEAEMFNYAIDLKSMTQARGYFEMEFVRYDQVPKELEDKIIKAAEKKEEN